MSEHPIKRALKTFQSRDREGGEAQLDAWCGEASRSEGERALAWTLRVFVRCLFGDQEGACEAVREAAARERAAGQGRGAAHTEELQGVIEAFGGGFKGVYQRLGEDLKLAQETTRSTQVALTRRHLGVMALIMGKPDQAAAMWAKSQQQLHFLDMEPEAQTLRGWLGVLR